MEIPCVIRLGPRDFTVTVLDRLVDSDGGKKLDGHIKYSECEIEIDGKLSGQAAKQVVWHEALHGLVVMLGQEMEESKIDALAYGIMQVLRDNEYLR